MGSPLFRAFVVLASVAASVVVVSSCSSNGSGGGGGSDGGCSTSPEGVYTLNMTSAGGTTCASASQVVLRVAADGTTNVVGAPPGPYPDVVMGMIWPDWSGTCTATNWPPAPVVPGQCPQQVQITCQPGNVDGGAVAPTAVEAGAAYYAGWFDLFVDPDGTIEPCDADAARLGCNDLGLSRAIYAIGADSTLADCLWAISGQRVQ